MRYRWSSFPFWIVLICTFPILACSLAFPYETAVEELARYEISYDDPSFIRIGEASCRPLSTEELERVIQILIQLPPPRLFDASDQSAFSDKHLETIINHMRNVEVLDIAGTPITDEGLKVVSACPKLKNVNANSTGIGDRGVDLLAKCEMLDTLWVSETLITDKGISALTRAKERLRSLHAAKTSISDHAISDLLKFEILEEIDFCNTRITGVGLGRLADEGRLTVVYARGLAMQCEILVRLRRCRDLDRLVLDDRILSSCSQTADLMKSCPTAEIKSEERHYQFPPNWHKR